MDASNLLRMTELGNPWGFASYTDEAMEIIAGSRIGLRRWLEQGLTHKQLGYWLGRPEGTGRGVFDRLVSRRSRNLLTHDVLYCQEFKDKFSVLLKKECVVWASRVAYPRQLPMSLGLQQLYIEEWDETLHVRGLTAGEVEEFGRAVNEGSFDHIMARLAVKVTTNGDGTRVFEDDDVEALSGKSPKAVKKLFDAAQRVSGLDETPAAVGND